MTFAVIQTGGKQYKVKASDILKIERLKDVKDKIEFNDVLAYGDDNSLEVGAPFIKGAKVEAQLVKNGKNKVRNIYSNNCNVTINNRIRNISNINSIISKSNSKNFPRFCKFFILVRCIPFVK